MMNRTAEYALRAVLHMAAAGSERPIRVGEIAAALRVPRNYLSKVLCELTHHGILTSMRGPQGGFLLAPGAADLTLARVVQPFDAFEDRCLLMDRPCSEDEPCTAHHQWKGVADRARGFFRCTTVAELLASAPSRGALERLPRTG